MIRRCVPSLLAMLLIGSVAGAAMTRYAAQLDASQDRLLKRSLVPSVEKPQGEVQLLQRGELIVVQTLLASRTLRQVAKAIAAKEERSWPADSAGHIGSLRYREELYQAVEKVREAFRKRENPAEKRQYLAIEFISGPRHSLIALSVPVLAGEFGTFRLVAKQVLKVWRAPRKYVMLNSRAILADSFGIDDAEVEDLLGAFTEDNQQVE